MAQLAFGAGGALLGGAIGGPLGASIGWAVGGLAGNLLFPTKGPNTQGPRLADLSVQSATYGTGIPVLFGTSRLAGNLIWSSGLREVANTRQAGKGGGAATNTEYTYYASWAVGLCEGPAAALRRIWFDDKLVYDSSGASVQVEVPGLRWRFYAGDESQLPDDIITANVGEDNAVAHRGLCYVVFDDVPLELMGNRIPNCSFEVVMSGGLTLQNDAITGRPASMFNSFMAMDWDAQRLWTVSGAATREIVATDLGSLASRVLTTVGTGTPRAFAHVPGAGLFYAFSNNSTGTDPLSRIDPDTGATTGTFPNGFNTSTTTRVSIITGGKQTMVPLQVFGPTGIRSFLLISPFDFAAGGYCLDADTLSYVWGSTVGGHPRLFQPSAVGRWVPGEQRAGETDALFLVPRTDLIEAWRVTVTSAAAGVASGPAAGQTVGVTATRLPDITAGALGHGSGFLDVRQCTYDREDGNFLLLTASGSNRIGKITRDGTVLWSAPGPFTQNDMGHQSRLDGGLISVLIDGAVVTYSTRDGALVASQSVAGVTVATSGWQFFNASTRALYAQTGTLGARRFLVMRQGSNQATLSSIVTTLCARAGLPAGDISVAALTDQVTGYIVARPDSVRSALEPLAAVYGFDAVESGDVLSFRKRGGASVATIAFDDLVRDGEGPVVRETRAQDLELPRRLTVRHLLQARDYEATAQHWQRPISPTPTMRSNDTRSLDLPIVITSDEAKATARRLLSATWRERARFNFTGTPQHVLIEPADPVTLSLIDGTTQRVRVISTQLGADWTMRFEAVAESAADYGLLATADGGQGFTPDAVPGPYGIRTVAAMLPLLAEADDLGGTGLRSYLLAGTYSGQAWRTSQAWRGDLANLSSLGAIRSTMAWGAVIGSVPVPATYWTWDEVTTITLQPAAGADRIVGATELEVLNGANLGALITPDGVVEIIQHQVATVNGDGSITLSRLLRGRRGTDDAGALSAAIYVRLDGAQLRISSGLSALNASETLRVVGAFQTPQEAPAVSRLHTGRAERPFSVVNIAGTRDGSNNLSLTWVRRTRLGGEWLDGVGDVPLGEPSEAYEVEIRNAGDTATLRTITGLTTPAASYTAAQQTTDGLTPGDPVLVRVYQISATVGRGIIRSATV